MFKEWIRVVLYVVILLVPATNIIFGPAELFFLIINCISIVSTYLILMDEIKRSE